MKYIVVQWLVVMLFLVGFDAAAQTAEAPLKALELKYPEISEQGNLSRLARVPEVHLVHAAATRSGRWWIIRSPGIAGNQPFLRLVALNSGKLDEYFVVSEGGVGMSAVEVYGPVNLNLAEIDNGPMIQWRKPANAN